MSWQSLKFSTACPKALFFSSRLIQVLENCLSRGINVARVHKYLVSFSVENLIVFLQHSIRFCDPVLYKLDTIVLPVWHLSLWCAADSFLQYTCQMTATVKSCLYEYMLKE